MTLVVVEGIDGSGKSTMIADLAHHLPDSVAILKRVQIKQHPMEEYVLPLLEYIPEIRTEHMLLDRWHVGELIYGPLYRGQSQLTPAMRMYVDMVLDRLGALKILMDTPLDVVRQRIAVRGEKYLQPQHQQLVWDAYREHCTGLDGWVMVPPKYNVHQIIASATQLEDDASELERFDSYVGPPKPSALILGDVRNPPVHGRPQYPWAFVPYRDTSGHFLLTALSAVGMQNFGLANAGEENVPDLWRALGEPPMCALGQNAIDYLLRYDDAEMMAAVVRTAQHPQYVRRFRNGTMMDYGHFIKETTRG